jgi:hypothetical protein
MSFCLTNWPHLPACWAFDQDLNNTTRCDQNFVSHIFFNLATPEAGAKHELLSNKLHTYVLVGHLTKT